MKLDLKNLNRHYQVMRGLCHGIMGLIFVALIGLIIALALGFFEPGENLSRGSVCLFLGGVALIQIVHWKLFLVGLDWIHRKQRLFLFGDENG